MSAILSKSQIESGARPAAAVELTPEGVLAAALGGRDAAPVYAFTPLPEGALVPGINESNLAAPEAVSKAIATALREVAPNAQSVTLLVPDSSVRVFVLDFDSLPAKPAEAIPVIKFRLRRLVPFDAEHAGVSYQVLTETKDEWRVLIAVMPGALLDEYEAAVRAAGFEPGAVLPSGLAALETIENEEPTLIACLGPHTLTTAIANGQDLMLYRTVDLPAGEAARISEIQRDVAVAAAFFEDKVGARPKQLFYSGSENANEFSRMLDDPSLEVVELAARPETGAATALGRMSFAGITGALTGAA
ncbi:MAG: hypothetical protein P4L40_16450 [Terracidiphilus sp.]|nr:hypothetical protein [Terracidiphilus sp.]